MTVKIIPLLIVLALNLSFMSTSSAESNQCEHLYFGDLQTTLDQLTETQLRPDNQAIRLPDAIEDYALRTALTEAATDHIHLYTFFIEDNKTGLDSAAQLVAKAVEGVEVNVLYSLLGQIFQSIEITAAMRNMGVNAYPYIPQNIENDFSALITSSHKKLLITDSKKYGLEAITGGRNVGDNYFVNVGETASGAFLNRWKDLDVLVRGPVITDLVDDFIKTFNRMSLDETVVLSCEDKSHCRYYPELTTDADITAVPVRLLHNEPDAHDGAGDLDINTYYLELLKAAKTSIDIQTPYFIPQPDLLKGLHEALDSGVKIRILTNSRKSNDLGAPLFYTSAFYWPDLIKAGAEIYLWDMPIAEGEPRTMHAKTMTVDGCVFAPGSWNFDGRSYYWENEYVTSIHSEALTAESTAELDEVLTLEGVIPIDREWFENNFTQLDYIKSFLFATVGTRFL
jgi:cardiolipin synthase A/B